MGDMLLLQKMATAPEKYSFETFIEKVQLTELLNTDGVQMCTVFSISQRMESG